MLKSFSFLFSVAFLYAGNVFSQADELPLKHIPDVTIIKSNRDFFSDDYPRLSIANVSEIYPQQNLGYLLERESGVLVKSYGGAGSLVSVSIHGTGSNHTQVNWNGFPLNSPTTGQADLSLIPSGFMQSIEIIHGASGALYGSGTFGGSINMGNEPDWNNRLAVDYSLRGGSFQAFGNNLIVKAGSRRIQYHASVLSAKADNDFPYRDYYRQSAPMTKAEHNSFRTWGIIQNIYLNAGKGNYIEAGLWHQHKVKEIPPLMGSYHESNAVQKDSLFRSYLSYKKIGEKSAFVIRTAYFSDYLNYTDKLSRTDSGYSINSKIDSRRMMNEADYRYYFTSSLILGGGISCNLATGRSENYPGIIREQDYAVFGNLKILHNNWIVNSGIRKEFYDHINPPLQYSLGIRYKAGNRLILRTGISSKFRKPTFNEKFWIPGGNPGLNPEKGWGGDISSEWVAVDRPEKGLKVEATVNLYFQHVDNWIQWVLYDSITPVEYKEVHASGIESNVSFNFSAGMIRFEGNAGYSFNRSVIIETYDRNPLVEGKQLMYVPKHSGRVNLKSEYKGLILGAGGVLTGRRETVETEDKTLRLPPFAYIDLYTGIKRKIRKINAGLYCRVDNLLNKQYEIMRSYPMAGRSYHLTLTLGLNNPVTEKN